MPAITPDTVRKMFMRQFATLSPERQDGIIEGLQVIRDARSETPQKDKEVVPTVGLTQPT